MQDRKRRKKIKNYVINRDGLACCYCGCQLTFDTVTLEHIVPDSRRGTFNSTNLTVSCSRHNNQRGNKSFFEYCKKFNWSEEKLKKYKKLYLNNLKIKVLNIAKEECLPKAINMFEMVNATELIQKACFILKIKSVDFSYYEKIYQFNIDKINEPKKIKFAFEQLIKIIESDSI